MSRRTFVALAVTVAVSGCSDLINPRDAEEASNFAEMHGEVLRRSGEEVVGSGCGSTPVDGRYDCSAIFSPKDRTVCFTLTEAGDSYRVSQTRPGRRFNPENLTGQCRP